MFLNNFHSTRFGLLLLSMHVIGCKGQSHSQAPFSNDSLVVNCYVLKPVKNDSKADSLRDFDFTKDSLGDFLSGIISTKNPVRYDSTMDYVTSFEYQKRILVNYNCFRKLNKPDSCDLLSLYFNSGFATWVKKASTVQFLQTYRKAIINFGNVTVFEYRFNNVAEIEPHFMYIILKDQTEDERRYGKDYKGIVICSDGMDWKDYTDKGFSIPLFTQMVRRSKEFYIPLYYDGERFIPIGHFKSANWQE
jgi:hypothetical protein